MTDDTSHSLAQSKTDTGPESIAGSCICHQVSFSILNNFQQFHLCHCEQCQKISGSAHVSNLFTRKDAITWLSGQTAVTRYDIPGRDISNAFCSSCGSPVPYISKSGKSLIVPAGSLDGTPNLGPQNHIFWEERARWYDDTRTIMTCAGGPP